MASVFIPTMLQSITGGVKEVHVPGTTVRQIIDGLEGLYPGIKDGLVEEGRMKPNISVAIDGEISTMGLLERLGDDSEVHFVPAIGGGARIWGAESS